MATSSLRHLTALVVALALLGCSSADDPEQATGGADASADEPASAGDEEGPVRLAIVRVDTTALGRVFGVDDDVPDVFAVDEKYVQHINDDGGIDGRMIDPTYHVVDVEADANAEGQRVCASLTEDDDVDFVVSHAFSNEVFLECLGGRGVAVIDDTAWTPDAEYLEQFPNWLPLAALGVDRYVSESIVHAVAEGSIEAGDTLGVLYEDCPWGGRTFDEVVRPLADDHGFEVEGAGFKCIENLVADLGPVTEGVRGAVLRFKAAGVTDVLVMSAAEGFVLSQFSGAAADQQFTPTYLVTTNGFPYNNSSIPDSPVSFADSALPQMSGLGWVPLIDVGDQAEPADGDQAALQEECRNAAPDLVGEIEADASEGRWQALMMYYRTCDIYFALRGLLEQNGVRLSIDEVRSGYFAFLSEGQSASLAGGRYATTGDRHDGVGLVRPLEYQGGEGFTYAGPAVEIQPGG